MPRFFVEGEPRGEYFLGGEDGRHAARSLRLRAGEPLTLCDGRGSDYPCRVLRPEGDGLWLQVGEPRPSLGEPGARITVCQCLPKGDKLETVVQKAVELGAAEIWPLTSARCVSRPDQGSLEKKTARLQRIAREAAQQSGRGAVPRVLPAAPLGQALQAAVGQGDALFFYEEGEASLKQALKSAGDRLFLFVGPEGGFDPQEAALARELGAKVLTLGRRILRTETAALAALSAILYERGDMEL